MNDEIIDEILNSTDADELKSLKIKLTKAIESLDNDGIYWHYTSFEALVSILSTDNEFGPTIRATNINFLNDKSEFSHGEKIVNNNGYKTIRTSDNIYSFSLSKAEDSLYQWLQYTPKETGVAIGFKLNTENPNSDFYYPYDFDREKLQIHSMFTHLAECLYLNDDVVLTDEHKSICKSLYRDTFRGKVPDHLLDVMVKAQSETGVITLLPFFIKHPAFMDEREVRVLFDQISMRNDDDEKKFDIKYTNKKPYVDLSFKSNLIYKLQISPRGDSNNMEDLIKHFMGTNLYLSHLDPETDLLKSNIPYRE
ncbi:Putative uncharacterized protein [Moritella viscosa]|uniref:DUF2971 domain-containing protein n=1 Tax=Moritella viscosa TaxID=80854 RepID=UPI0005092579|nr:DUF2971 domain-containing protein [Moritella viscosa]CED59186.1 putative uncharacterized protein [Moritella viscosa]SHO00251.1 Putative uncharacterized protein [Moritella viscosa]SHO20256.1 Putative uncharacterized protein [Moritella viscosa]